MGRYPVAAVEAMSRIAEETEKDIDYAKRFRNSNFKIRNTIDAVSHSTAALSIDIDARLIVVCTRSGATARMVSRFRSPKPIIGMTTEEKVWRCLLYTSHTTAPSRRRTTLCSISPISSAVS